MAFAGAAAAEVKVGGDARMGVTYLEGAADEFALNHRVRVKFTASGETDGGLSWEATARLRSGKEVNSAGVATDTNRSDQLGVTISGAFGSLTFGSESSAAEYAVGDLAGVTFGAGPVNNETTFITGARALYSYSTSGLTFWLSTGDIGSEAYSAAVQYKMDALTVALGYEDSGSNDHIVGSLAYTFGNTTVKGIYGKADVADTAASTTYALDAKTGTIKSTAVAATSGLDTQWGLSLSHKVGAATLKGFYRVTENNAGVDKDYYGIGADYALGGGATLAGGISSNDGTTAANIGVKFSF